MNDWQIESWKKKKKFICEFGDYTTCEYTISTDYVYVLDSFLTRMTKLFIIISCGIQNISAERTMKGSKDQITKMC